MRNYVQVTENPGPPSMRAIYEALGVKYQSIDVDGAVARHSSISTALRRSFEARAQCRILGGAGSILKETPSLSIG